MTETNAPGLRLYHAAVVFSVLFSLAGFSYNLWRMEVTETNSNIRTAGFEILLASAELQQIVYAAHFDQDMDAGSPRKGWVRVLLIRELSVLTSPSVVAAAEQLHRVWREHWADVPDQREATDRVVEAIENLRAAMNETLVELS